ncbi:MAG TPA: RICIN domain-containing protein [Kineosporiaceae bacterium]|nr:RICIN domain-containing protein [Kineosporiaceae bacterium]
MIRGRRLFSRRGAWAAVALALVAGSLVALGTTRASAGTVDTQAWYVLVNRNSGKVLEDYAFATNDGAAVVQWSRHDGNNQQWRFIDAGGGYYRLQNRKSGKVLDNYKKSKSAGTAIVQWRDLSGSNQQFKVVDSSDGYVRLINRLSGMAVEVDSGSKADGGKVVQYWDWKGVNQQWQLVPAGSAGTATAGGGATTSPAPSSTPSSSTSSPAAGGATATPAPSSTPSSSTSSPAAAGGSSTKSFLGSSTVLIGGSMSDDSAKAAPFDMRYSYVHSKPAPSSDYYTAKLCQDAWTSWWGCWTGSTTPPGYQVTYWNERAAQATYQGKSRPQTFFLTWYSLRDLGDMAGQGDGPGEVKAINRADLLTLYLNDYRFFLQTIGKSRDAIDLEPDFWGYVLSLGNPHQVPAQVTSANPTDCGSQENSAAGLARCLIAMGHKYAPNAAVGLHLTCWNWETKAKECVNNYLDLGAKDADLLVADVSDRDAGWYAQPANGGRDTFWTDQKAAAFLSFSKTATETVGKPLALWQIPLGNMAQNNTFGHYKDDKVDWLLSHLNQVADAHIVALLFGPGQQEQTTVESDGGNLINKTIAYRNSGGTALK